MKHIAVAVCLVGVLSLAGIAASQDGPIAYVMTGGGGVVWEPLADFSGLTLSVAKPDGEVLEETFPSGTTPFLDLTQAGTYFPDGQYTWELRAIASETPVTRGANAAADAEATLVPQVGLTQSGHFRVSQGSVVEPSTMEDLPLKDYVHSDDVIVEYSLCVGFDCAVDGSENFGADTIRLKENNLRIHFDDTSTSASYPANDWRIAVNDNTNGGASYFAVVDITEGSTPFKIEAGAPNSSLYVEDYGRVGLGTATPAVELHIRDHDTPTMRLEQDSSGGWTPQTWDVAGNESNFFIRDVTNGSRLPFRIQPDTPSSTLVLKNDGFVGIGTWSPYKPLELETTGVNAYFLMERTDGSSGFMAAAGSVVNFGSATDHAVNLAVNNVWKMRMNTDGSLTMANGATCSVGGEWLDASSKELKKDIEALSSDEATKALADLSPVKFRYKADQSEECVGFIAEDVPDLVATKDRKGMSPMDVTAVLTKVVQEQQQVIAELQSRIEALEQAQ